MIFRKIILDRVFSLCFSLCSVDGIYTCNNSEGKNNVYKTYLCQGLIMRVSMSAENKKKGLGSSAWLESHSVFTEVVLPYEIYMVLQQNIPIRQNYFP